MESPDECQDFLRWLSQDRPILAIDSETGGLEWWKQPLRLVQFGDGQDGWAISYRNWRGLIQTALERYEGPVVFHNAKFDLHFLEAAGLPLPKGRTHDTMAMAHLLDPRQSVALKTLARVHVDPAAADNQAILKQAFRTNGWDWGSVPEDFPPYWTYSAYDTVLTAQLAELLMPQIKSGGFTEPYEMEMAVLDIARKAETRGVLIDRQYTEGLRDEWEDELADIEVVLAKNGVAQAGSDRQVAAVLERQGWTPAAFTPTGLPKMDESVLSAIDNPIAKRVLRHRRLVKWSSTYLDAFLGQADQKDRLHANLRTFKARTGRMSITTPPLQTLPKGSEIRNCFIPNPGEVLVSVDYSQIEMRIFAHFAREEEMIHRINEGMNVHQATAEALYGPDFTDKQQNMAKAGNFAKVYGAGTEKFAKTAKMGLAEAEQFNLAYDARFPGVARFTQEVIQAGRTRYSKEGMAYVRTPSGRRLIADPKKIYSLVNFLAQGTAAEVLKKAMVDLARSQLDKYMLLPIHDELLFSVPEAEAETITKEIVSLMEDHTSFAVPLTVKASGPMNRWGE